MCIDNKNNVVPTKSSGSRFSSHLNKKSRNQENFFYRLKSRREELDISQKSLAEKIGVSSNTIQSWEKNTHPKGNDLVLLANVLNCSTDWLLKGVENRSIDQNGVEALTGHENKLQEDLLRKIIKAVEDELRERNLELEPEKKAETISLLYEMYADTEKEVSGQTVGRYLNLVA